MLFLYFGQFMSFSHNLSLYLSLRALFLIFFFCTFISLCLFISSLFPFLSFFQSTVSLSPYILFLTNVFLFLSQCLSLSFPNIYMCVTLYVCALIYLYMCTISFSLYTYTSALLFLLYQSIVIFSLFLSLICLIKCVHISNIYMCVCIYIYIYIYIYIKKKLKFKKKVVDHSLGQTKGSFTIATTLRCSRGLYSFS